MVEDGYEFFADRRLVTLFSAPNYCGEFDNAGSMMTVNVDLMCSFQVGRESRPVTAWPSHRSLPLNCFVWFDALGTFRSSSLPITRAAANSPFPAGDDRSLPPRAKD